MNMEMSVEHYRDSQDRPVGMWSMHARQRRLWLCKLRAFVSMAGLRDRMMLLNLKRGDDILDIGCGGGRPILTTIGRVSGLEPIKELAVQARKVYPEVAEGYAEEMPFPNERFDAVVSTDILGHIPVATKDAVISEIHRVLRPGGMTLHLAEVDSDGWVARIAKREPIPYQKTWVDEPDHRAMEPAGVLIERFRKAGFVIEKAQPMQAIIPQCGFLSVAFREHEKLPVWLKALRSVDRQLSRREVLSEIVCLALTPFAVVNLFGRVESGLGLILRARKPAVEADRTRIRPGDELK